MSAEKEVVNFWLNGNGFYTVTDLKSRNKDIGILAFKLKKNDTKEILHLEILCSLTGFADIKTIEKSIIEKFNDKKVNKIIDKYSGDIKAKKIAVLNSLPKEKNRLIKKLENENIEIMEFEKILKKVITSLNTNYFKEDMIRVLQFLKFSLMQSSADFIDLISKNLTKSRIREFLRELRNNDLIMTEHKKISDKKLALIIKQSKINPKKLAEIISNDVLNQRTRKPFLMHLLEQKKMKQHKRLLAKKRKNMSLRKYMG